jgi:hypothetical protein
MALTDAGRQWVIDKLQDVAPASNAKQTAIGWGTGSTAESAADTALVTEASEARVTGTLSQPTATTDRLVGTMTAAGSKTITEVGRFNSTTVAGSIMQQRHVFTGIPLVANDQIQFTLDLTD